MKEPMLNKRNVFFTIMSASVIAVAAIAVFSRSILKKSGNDNFQTQQNNSSSLQSNFNDNQYNDEQRAVSNGDSRGSQATSDWKAYRNTKYDFQLTFTEDWQGLSIVTKQDQHSPGITYLYFEVPTRDPLYSNTELTGYAAPLVLSIFPKTEWERLLKEHEGEVPGPDGRKIAENETYIFTAASWQDSPRDFGGKNFDFDKVVSSFKFIE